MVNSYNRGLTTPKGWAQDPSGRANLYNQTYVGFVRKVEDDIFMGRLKVWIPDLGGDSDQEESWYTVNYCSPFAGATPIKKFENNRKNQWVNGNIKDGKEYTQTQNSYGFWMVPPDIDNEVIVQFINGDPNKGIWIGCMYKQYMNHMVPGLAVGDAFQDAACGAEEPPVAEYNKFSEIGNNTDPTRPRYDPLHNGLQMQGLYTDDQRGTTTASARRDKTSQVYGFLTPDASQIYADDNPDNQFIRLRTKSGVQILINETCGYIYMITKKGNSWVEISDDAIDMYTTKTFNVHSENGINLHSNKDFNLHVGGNFNAFVEGDVKWGTAGNWDQITKKDHKLDIGGAFHSTIEQNRNILVKGSDSLDVNGNLTQHSDKVFTMTADGLLLEKGAQIKMNCTDTPNEPTEPTPAEIKDPCVMPDRNLTECYPETTRKSVTTRMPTHEPFAGHSFVCGDEEYWPADCSGSSESDGTEDPNAEDPNDSTDPTDPNNPENNQDNPNNPNNPNDNQNNPNNPSDSSSSDPNDSSPPTSSDSSSGGSSSSSSGGSSSSSSGGSSSSSSSSGGGSSSGGSGSGSGNAPSSNSPSTTPNPNDLMDSIADSANTNSGLGYNSTEDNGAYVDGTPQLTDKTIDEINNLQNQMKENPNNTGGKTGVGKYNLSQPSLQGAIAGAGLSGSKKFSATNQDKIAKQILQSAGLTKFVDGKITQEEFIENIADVWPTMPNNTGKTNDDKVPGVSLPDLKNILTDLKNPSKTPTTNETVKPGQVKMVGKFSIGKVINGFNVGTGFVVDYSGTVMTNAQVVGILNAKVGDMVHIEIGERLRLAKLIAMNPTKDTAHIRIINDDFADLIPIEMGGSTTGSLNAYGYAFGSELIAMPATFTGQTNKSAVYTGPGLPNGKLTVYGLSVITTQDANGLKPGMAGGPLLDANGKLVGLNAANVAGSNEAKFIPS